MNVKLFAGVVLALVALAPNFAEARHNRHHRHHHHHWPLPYPISYLHNYGPGPTPGTFAYYDGSTRDLCWRGAAAYLGQGGRYPCY